MHVQKYRESGLYFKISDILNNKKWSRIYVHLKRMLLHIAKHGFKNKLDFHTFFTLMSWTYCRIWPNPFR